MKKLKKAMPHIITDKGRADLYFEYVEPFERNEFFEDFTSPSEPNVSLPDFGKIRDIDISNPKVKIFNLKDISKDTEEFIKRFIKDKKKPKRDFLEYDEKTHKFVLKPKYNLEKMITEVTKSN